MNRSRGAGVLLNIITNIGKQTANERLKTNEFLLTTKKQNTINARNATGSLRQLLV